MFKTSTSKLLAAESILVMVDTRVSVKTLANKVLCQLPDCGTVFFSFFLLIIPHEIKTYLKRLIFSSTLTRPKMMKEQGNPLTEKSQAAIVPDTSQPTNKK